MDTNNTTFSLLKYNDKYPTILNQLTAICIIYLIAYIYSLILAPMIAEQKSGEFYKTMNDFHKKCIVCCDGCEHLTTNRGENYYIADMTNTDPDVLSKCLFTFWGLSHMIAYSLIGYYAPSFFIPTFIIGAGFEYYEYLEFGCEDPLDVVWNSIGFLAGQYIRDQSL